MKKNAAFITVILLWLFFPCENLNSQYQWLPTSHEYNDAQFYRLLFRDNTICRSILRAPEFIQAQTTDPHGSPNNGLPQFDINVITVSGANIFVGGAYGNIHLSTTTAQTGYPQQRNARKLCSIRYYFVRKRSFCSNLHVRSL